MLVGTPKVPSLRGSRHGRRGHPRGLKCLDTQHEEHLLGWVFGYSGSVPRIWVCDPEDLAVDV